MRQFGLMLAAVGLAGFLYCGLRQGDFEPVPPGTETMEALRYPAGRFEIGRYASAMVGAIGVLLAMFPKGR
jgi:hypothetical protein